MHNVEVQNNNELDINCYKIMGPTEGTYHIEIQSAVWWITEDELLTNGKDKTEEVKQKCDNKYKCNMTFKSDSDKLFMKIVIFFVCHVGHCPHKTFEEKHVDTANKSALVFVKIAEENRVAKNWAETNVTTIYTNAYENEYKRHPLYDEICLFTLPNETYQCKKADEIWSCNKKDPEIGEHDTITGHRFTAEELKKREKELEEQRNNLETTIKSKL